MCHVLHCGLVPWAIEEKVPHVFLMFDSLNATPHRRVCNAEERGTLREMRASEVAEFEVSRLPVTQSKFYKSNRLEMTGSAGCDFITISKSQTFIWSDENDDTFA
jgi:hypothetical protein